MSRGSAGLPRGSGLGTLSPMRATAAAGLLLLAHGVLAAAGAADSPARSEPGPAPAAIAGPECHYLGEFRVTYYFVAEEDGRPVGIIHIHDLLRAGVV